MKHYMNMISRRKSEPASSGNGVKWYKNAGILLGIGSFLFTISTFTYNNYVQTNDKLFGRLDSKVKRTIDNIEKLTLQTHQYNISASSITDESAKMVLGISYSTVANALLDNILKDYDSVVAGEINCNLLMNFANGLDQTGRNELSERVFKNALFVAKDNIDSSNTLRYMASLYSKESNIKSLKKMRECRQLALEVQKSNAFTRVNNAEYSRSFELWAADEYFGFNNRSAALELIDSAMFHLAGLPDYNMLKRASDRRLKDMRLYILMGISKDYFPLNWKIYMDNGSRRGYAKIFKSGPGILSIEIGLYASDMLLTKIRGSGTFTKHDELHFEINGTEALLPGLNVGDLDLKIVNKNKITGQYAYLGRSKGKCYLIKEGD